MERLNSVLLIAALILVSLPACAAHPQADHHKGRVVRAIPVYETIRYPVDEQVCWEEPVRVGKFYRHHGFYPVVRTRCEIQRTWRLEQRVAAWDVSYRYRGAIYTTRTLERPGKHIRVGFNAVPARRHYGS
jgi:uncharacterized protein YcfJ